MKSTKFYERIGVSNNGWIKGKIYPEGFKHDPRSYPVEAHARVNRGLWKEVPNPNEEEHYEIY